MSHADWFGLIIKCTDLVNPFLRCVAINFRARKLQIILGLPQTKANADTVRIYTMQGTITVDGNIAVLRQFLMNFSEMLFGGHTPNHFAKIHAFFRRRWHVFRRRRTYNHPAPHLGFENSSLFVITDFSKAPIGEEFSRLFHIGCGKQNGV